MCVYSIWDNGKLKAFSQYHSKKRFKSGAGIYFQPEFNDLILEQVKRFGEKIHYPSQLSFDIIINKLGIPFYIECNPRATSGGHLINTKLATAF